jgi:hypothetical protein
MWVPARTRAARQADYGNRVVALGGGTDLPVFLEVPRTDARPWTSCHLCDVILRE